MNHRPPTKGTHRRGTQDNLRSVRSERRPAYVNRSQPAERNNSRWSTSGETPVVLTGFYPIHIAPRSEVQR